MESDIVGIRRELHAMAELSGFEHQTAEYIARFLAKLSPDSLITGLGGAGIAAVFRGKKPGKTVMFRAELDAVPITEQNLLEHASRNPGVSHACGHDGHMVILLALAKILSPRGFPGTVILLFQPAEETGQGAKLVLEDARIRELSPDCVFALHNIPGYPEGHVLLRRGVFACASVGCVIELEGQTSHAGEPSRGKSPALPMMEIIRKASELPGHFSDSMVTVIHARLGERAFGTAPGSAQVMLTLRAHRGDTLERMQAGVSELVSSEAGAGGLSHGIEWVEEFPETRNSEECMEMLESAVLKSGIPATHLDKPFWWSEDFGHFTARYCTAMFGIGAGESYPRLHSQEYDFPDAIIGIGVDLLHRLVLMGDG